MKTVLHASINALDIDQAYIKVDEPDYSDMIEYLHIRPLQPLGLYQVRNVPFYDYTVGYKDLVKCSPDSEGVLRITSLVERSDWSTFRFFVNNPGVIDVQGLITNLVDFGCVVERYSSKLYSVAVKDEQPFYDIAAYFDTLYQDPDFDIECESAHSKWRPTT